MQRPTISLDGQWELFIDPQGRLGPGSLGAAGAGRPVRVPGPWQAQHADLRDYAGLAWYRRSFVAEPAPAGLEPYLCFGAVDYHATVWLNGQPLGEHEGGYLPFALPAPALQAGENELVVRVLDPGPGAGADAGYSFDEIPHGKQSWYGPLGGIWQSVRLEHRAPDHLTLLHITPDLPGARAQVTVRLSRPLPGPRSLLLRLIDPRGHLSEQRHSLAAGARTAAIELAVPAPLAWDIGQPNLYRLEASLLSAAGEPADTLSATFGMRSIDASPDGRLLLNGRPIYLRGALDQDYYPDLIATPFSDAELDAQLQQARHMGLNCLRTHIKISDPRYYDAADRAGVLIWTELPNWELLSEAAKTRARATLAGMLERDWNHPSIIIWTIINEGWGVDLAGNPEHRAWLAETYDWLKAQDPQRLAVGNSACYSNFQVVTDIEDFHNYYGIPDYYRRWRDWVASFAGRASWSYAHAAGDYADWQRYAADPWGDWPRQLLPEVRRRGDEPLIVSEFGNWGLPDVGKLYAAYGGEPWWFETGFEWGEGVVYPHGIEQRFRAYHLDRVFGDLAGLAAASQRMQLLALKYEIEQLRRHPSIVGYVITELTDVHWECNGLLDMCRNPKIFYDELGALNADDALVPLWERTVYRPGERCRVELLLSHYSARELGGARIEWWLQGHPGLRGGAAAQPAERYGVAPAGLVELTMPALAAPARLRLELRLLDSEGVAAATYQDLYLFPPAAPPDLPVYSPEPELSAALAGLGYRLAPGADAAAVVVVTTLTDEERRHALAGGRVLLLAEAPEALRVRIGELSIKARRGRSWEGNWASSLSWLRRDTIFGSIPTDGLVDFAFADLTPEHVITGVFPRHFADRVHAGLFVGWVHKAAALVAEHPVGRGCVLLSTFRLRAALAHNPLAQELLRAMIAGLAGGDSSLSAL